MVEHILKKIIAKSRGSGLRFIYTESLDERIIIGAKKIYDDKIALPYLIGDEDKIKKRLKELKVSEKAFVIVDPKKSPKFESYVNELVKLQKEKGLTKEKATSLMKQPNYFGTMMVQKGEGDCLISGAVYTTVETLRPALQIVGTKKGKLASSFFLMVLNDKVYFFADCSMVRGPNADELSEIAISTADSAEKFGIKPRVALLSYSTKGSGFGESVDRVRKASEIAKRKRPDLNIEGEVQLDAAIVPRVAKLKCPESRMNGNSNVLIFPDLNSGNIGYKLVERLAKAKALGPIVQGLNKEINVLSRGCDSTDVYNISAITVMRALEKGKKHFRNEKHLMKK